jgi:hypothetical protein
MEASDVEQLTGLLQAHLIGLSALFRTHPEPEKLRATFEELAARASHPHPAYQLSLGLLRKALP